MSNDFPQTLPELLTRAAKLWPNRPYLQTRDRETVHAQTFAQVAEEVAALARGLTGMGIGRGEHVALLSENRREWVTSYFAISSAGAVVIPLDSLMSPAEITHILEVAKARLLITSRKFHATMQLAASEFGIEQLSLEAVPEPGEKALPRAAGVSLPCPAPSDLAVIIFTSGTTGFSKGVMLSHENICSDVDGVLQAIDIDANDNFHLLLPLNHTYSSTVNMLVPLGGGARATFATSYKSRDILDDIRIARVTLLVGVPQVYENIMSGIRRAVGDASAFRRLLFRVFYTISAVTAKFGVNAGRLLFKSLRANAGMASVRFLISGGAALRLEVNRFFARLGFTLLQGYGLTETSPILTVSRPRLNRIGSVGPAIPGVQLKIAAPDPATGVGEICARGRNVMLGYYENHEATANVLRDGWFHTGDAGYLDRFGCLHITGRMKSVIITGAGKNVYPEEIEAQLNSSPFVLESIVLGLERKRGTGEELFALIVPDRAFLDLEKEKGREIDLTAEIQAVVDAYNKSVPTYRSLRGWQLREEEFVKTSSRKIKRYLYKNAYVDAKQQSTP